MAADMLAQIHVRMLDYIQQYGGKVQSILFCPHHPDENCECRKPKTGLYQELVERLNVSLDKTFSVGDSLRDLIAANDAGATPILVRTGNGKKTMKQLKHSAESKTKGDSSTNVPELDELKIFDNLAKFVDALLSNKI